MTRLTITADGLDADAVAQVLRTRQAALATGDAAPAQASETLLAFVLGGVPHALPIAAVRAVAALPVVAAVPRAPPALIGLVAWRGAVINLFAPGELLGRSADAPGAMIVLRHEHPRIAIAVDRLLGVVAARADEAPPTLARLVDADDERLTRIDPAILIDLLLPARLQEG